MHMTQLDKQIGEATPLFFYWVKEDKILYKKVIYFIMREKENVYAINRK